MSSLRARAQAFFVAPAVAAPTVAAPRTVAPAALAGVVADPRDLPAAAGALAAELRRAASARTAIVCRPDGGGIAPAALPASVSWNVPVDPFDAASTAHRSADPLSDAASCLDGPPPGCAHSVPPAAAASVSHPGGVSPARAAASQSGCAGGGAGSRAGSGAATLAAARLARRLAQRGLPAVGDGALCRLVLPDDVEEAVRIVWRVAAAAGDVPVIAGFAHRSVAIDSFLAQTDRLALGCTRTTDPVYTALALASLARLGPPAHRLDVPSGLLARRAAAVGLGRRVSSTPTPAPSS